MLCAIYGAGPATLHTSVHKTCSYKLSIPVSKSWSKIYLHILITEKKMENISPKVHIQVDFIIFL